MPDQDDYGQGILVGNLDDAPDYGKLAHDLADGLVPRGVLRYQSATTRNATIPNPVGGMLAWLETERLLTVYDGVAWSVVAAGTQAWTTIPLASGYSHDGNDNGTAQYRLVNLFGETSLMFRGGIGITYSGGATGTPPNNSRINSSLLPDAARPATKRTIPCACSVQNTTLSSIKLDINADGTLVLIGIGSTSENPPWVSLNGCFASL